MEQGHEKDSQQQIPMERRVSDSLFVQTAGRRKCMPGWHQEETSDHYGLRHVLSGCGCLQWEGETWELGPGSCFLTFPGVPVTCGTLGQEPWVWVWVGFSGERAEDCVRLTGLCPRNPVVEARQGYEAGACLRELLEACGPEPADCLAMTGHLYRLLAALTRQGEKQQPSGVPDCVELAVAYLEEHYQEELPIDRLAALSSVSHSGLYRGFLTRFGMSPKRYLTEYRVEKAKRLLTETNLPVGEIGRAVGFEDPQYFSRVFRKLTGLSPRDYGAQGNR